MSGLQNHWAWLSYMTGMYQTDRNAFCHLPTGLSGCFVQIVNDVINIQMALGGGEREGRFPTVCKWMSG